MIKHEDNSGEMVMHQYNRGDSQQAHSQHQTKSI